MRRCRCQAEFDEFFKEPTAEAAEALAKLSADDQMIEDNKRRTRQLGNITFIAGVGLGGLGLCCA